MHNNLINASIVTMIGNIPDIINRNNQLIKDEFDYVFTYDSSQNNPKLKVDVTCNSVTSHTGYFQNLNFNGVVLNSSIAYKYNQIDTTLKDFETRIENLEEHIINSSSTTQQMTYGSVNENYVNEFKELDMSSLFSTKGNGYVPGVTLDDIYKYPIYRIINSNRVPLIIGTCNVVIDDENKISLMLYHEHIDNDTKQIQKIYVPIAYNPEIDSIVQLSGANILTIK